MTIQGALQDGEVIEGDDRGQVYHRLGSAARVGDGNRRIRRSHLVGRRLDGYQQGIVVAVIGGLDLDQPVAAGEAARQPDGIQGRLGAAVREAPLWLVETLGQLGGDDGVVLDRLREVSAFSRPLADGFDDQGMSVSNHHHTETVVKVDVLIAIHVPDPAALAPVGEDRLWCRVLE